MKIMKKLFFKTFLICSLFFTFENSPVFSKNSWQFDLTTQGAYYPKSDYIPGKTHFSPVTGIFSAIEAKTQFNAEYTIQTPLGKNPLLKSANIKINPLLEFSPVSLMPAVKIYFSPLPFLVFSTGASIGTGWNLFGLQGIAVLKENQDEQNVSYEDARSFLDYRYEFYAKALFQFDTGALISGDWSHVVMQLSYKLSYTAMTACKTGDIWLWQTSNSKANGLNYQIDYVLAYQMPLFLKMAGIMGDFYGYFSNDSYGQYGKNYNGTFVNIDLSPFVQFEIAKKHQLYILFNFKGRRSFYEPHENSAQEIFLTQSGREWIFYRIAFNWVWKL